MVDGGQALLDRGDGPQADLGGVGEATGELGQNGQDAGRRERQLDALDASADEGLDHGLELAARIQAMSDDALDQLVVERQAPAQLSSTFDLAEHLLSDASIAQALRWRSAAELAALAAGTSTPRLDTLLLGVDRVALPAVQALAAADSGNTL